GAYESVDDVQAFSQVLTHDLQYVSNDLHCGVIYDPRIAGEMTKVKTPKEQHAEASRIFYESKYKGNLGFVKLEKLFGNIGYIDLRGFVPAKDAGDLAIATMTFLSNSNALIFDLRMNEGGHPSMIILLTSYLFDESKHINTFYYRDTDEYEQFWTFEYVPSRGFLPNIPVYILTSKRTVSAAEEFAYNLKQLKRATIVGETTQGGAHMINWEVINEDLVICVPFGRPINPITKTNWEGVGVKPDIVVLCQEALKIAHIHALEQLISSCKDDEPINILQSELEEAKEYYENKSISNF
ncbi:MAG: S41 family peptidase, partial [Candidatus Hodarchaeales archaeon]